VKYLAITAKAGNNYVGWFADNIPALATANSREQVEVKLSRCLASLLSEGVALPQPETQALAQSLAGVAVTELEGANEVESCWIDAAPINAVSLEITAALQQAGIRPADLARQLGMSRASVARLTDPFYWGHSLASLQRIAEALKAKLTIKIEIKSQ
jgi:hypothetical protein